MAGGTGGKAVNSICPVAVSVALAVAPDGGVSYPNVSTKVIL